MQSLLVVINALPFILQGCVVTVAAVGLALSMGLCFGLPFAIIQVFSAVWSLSMSGSSAAFPSLFCSSSSSACS